MTRANTTSPIEKLLSMLPEARETGTGWASLCPAHDDQNPSLSIAEAEDGTVLLNCFAGCAPEDILAAIGLGMADLFLPRKLKGGTTGSGPGLTLEEYADTKRLPIDFLRELGIGQIQLQGMPVVRMPYMDANSIVVATRMRLSMSKNPKFIWRTGDKPCLYGLWRLNEYSGRYLCLVEGESCAHTLWMHKIPALGVPGAESWRESWAEYLDRFERIYVVIEPDEGGEAVLRWLRSSAIRDRARLIKLDGFKDASDLYLSDPDQFTETWKATMRSAEPWSELESAEREAARKAAWKECRDLARSKDLLSLLVEDMRRRNVAGETRAVKLLYLSLNSRFLPRPVSAAVVAPSSAGKSFVVEQTLAYFPASAYYALTAMSEKALAYSSEPLKNRFLVLFEGAALNSDFQNYLIRSLLSEGRVRYETIEKTPEGLQARLIEREGPTGLFLTTTALSLHPENATRLLSIPVSDSTAQTQRVLRALAMTTNDGVAGDLSSGLGKWHALQEWLTLSEHRVYIPYATSLASLVPPVAVRLRRDFGAILSLIKAHAILHQANRKRDDQGRIVAQLSDYRVVRELVNALISQGVGQTVPKSVRATVEAVFEICQGDGGPELPPTPRLNGEPITASVAEVAQALRLERSSASRRINQAVTLGYLRNLETKRGQPHRLVVGDALPGEQTIMPTPEELRARWKSGE